MNTRFTPRAPSLTALKSATRSAHIVTLNEAFSMFVPSKTTPSSVSSAQPTRTPE